MAAVSFLIMQTTNNICLNFQVIPSTTAGLLKTNKQRRSVYGSRYSTISLENVNGWGKKNNGFLTKNRNLCGYIEFCF